MIIFEDKAYQTRSDKPNEDWTGEAKYVVDDESELARKIIKLFPYFDFVEDVNGKLIDVIELPKPEPLPKEQRELAYTRDPVILWESEQITVDEAVKLYASYFVEQSKKANELQALIMEAKQNIRNQYPDENKV